MERHWQGLDFLRGLGILLMLVMHSAFYYYDGLWDLDLDNPPLIITIIGLLLMFAGLFGMISGAVHTISIQRLYEHDYWQPGRIMRKKLVTGLFILVTAWIYFIFTGPGLADFAGRRMNNSILVDWIREGRWAGIDPERLFYVDSLVMIGSNTLLVSLICVLLLRAGRLKPRLLPGLGGLVMLLSLVRLPLYPWYLDQVANERWLSVIATFWLINKNNPVLPFLAFGLFGSWLGLILETGLRRLPAILTGVVLLLSGIIMYVFLPDTMLERAIDLKWYSIMLAQLGLFILLILGAVSLFDGKHLKVPAQSHSQESATSRRRPGTHTGQMVFRFITRFGVAGLTAFFWESVVAAIVWRLVRLFWPDLRLGIGSALLYGLLLALVWGIALAVWERFSFKGTLEYVYGQVVGRLGGASSKAGKLQGRIRS